MKAQALNQPLKRFLITVFILSGIWGVKAQSASTLYLTGTKDTNATFFQTDLKTGNSNLTDQIMSLLNKTYKVVFIKESNSIYDEAWIENTAITKPYAINANKNEEEIALEDWMTDFNTAASAEKEMKLESWMSNFHTEMNSNTVESEEKLALEPWMSNFNVELKAQKEDSVTEPELKIEDWMVDASQWNPYK